MSAYAHLCSYNLFHTHTPKLPRSKIMSASDESVYDASQERGEEVPLEESTTRITLSDSLAQLSKWCRKRGLCMYVKGKEKANFIMTCSGRAIRLHVPEDMRNRFFRTMLTSIDAGDVISVVEKLLCDAREEHRLQIMLSQLSQTQAAHASILSTVQSIQATIKGFYSHEIPSEVFKVIAFVTSARETTMRDVRLSFPNLVVNDLTASWLYSALLADLTMFHKRKTLKIYSAKELKKKGLLCPYTIGAQRCGCVTRPCDVCQDLKYLAKPNECYTPALYVDGTGEEQPDKLGPSRKLRVLLQTSVYCDKPCTPDFIKRDDAPSLLWRFQECPRAVVVEQNDPRFACIEKLVRHFRGVHSEMMYSKLNIVQIRHIHNGQGYSVFVHGRGDRWCGNEGGQIHNTTCIKFIIRPCGISQQCSRCRSSSWGGVG